MAKRMGIRLKITVKTERVFIRLKSPTVDHWCEACGSESAFVDEVAEASTLAEVLSANTTAHRTQIDGRGHLCLRSVSVEE